jgi:hypothetical protein
VWVRKGDKGILQSEVKASEGEKQDEMQVSFWSFTFCFNLKVSNVPKSGNHGSPADIIF